MEYELTEKQKKKLERRLTLENNANLAILEELEELNDNIEELKSKEMPKMEMPEVHKVEVDMKGIEIMTLKGEKGDKGDTPSNEELVEIIKPLIPEPKSGRDGIDGKNGRDGKDGIDGLNGKDGIDGKDGKDGSPDTPEQIIEKINSSEEQIDKERIKGLEDLVKELRNEIKVSSASKGSPRRIYQPHIERFTSETDGVNKTFYLQREPLKSELVEVTGTDFPIILDPTIDFTVSGRTVTLSNAIQAPSQGATLIIKYYA